MGKKQLTPEEQVTRWEHIRAIENLVGKMTYYGIHCWDYKIWDEMWAKKAEDVTLGFNNGYYKGAEAIEGYYKATMELLKLRTEVVKAANPDKFEGKRVEEIFGAGSLDVNNFTTPIVELAEDMQTAKGLWYYMRGNTNYDETGIATYHQWGWMGIDFIYEDGAWKIWHMVNAEDLNFRAGTTWVEKAEPLPVLPEYAAIADFKFPEPNVSAEVYELWHDRRKNVDFPGVPQPYHSFADTFTYGL